VERRDRLDCLLGSHQSESEHPRTDVLVEVVRRSLLVLGTIAVRVLRQVSTAMRGIVHSLEKRRVRGESLRPVALGDLFASIPAMCKPAEGVGDHSADDGKERSND